MDAVSAPSPAVPARSPAGSASSTPFLERTQDKASPAAEASAKPAARFQPPKLKGTTRQLSRSFLSPLAVFGGALWLRVTGAFFTLIAWVLAAGAWRLRSTVAGSMHTSETRHFWIFVTVASLFAYFAVSSFMRAARRERHT